MLLFRDVMYWHHCCTMPNRPALIAGRKEYDTMTETYEQTWERCLATAREIIAEHGEDEACFAADLYGGMLSQAVETVLAEVLR